MAAILATIYLYWPGLTGGFLFDDYPNIVNNSLVHATEFSLATLNDIWAVSGTPDTRPLSVASFALNFYFTGLDPIAFKAVNLAIHLTNGLLIFVLMRAIVRRAAGSGAEWLPVWVSAAWLLHPINLTAVLLTVQRMTELAALFTLAGLWLYTHIRSLSTQTWPKLLTGGLTVVALWGLGILAKPSALLAPLFALLLEVFIFRRDGPKGSYMDRMGKVLITLILTLYLVGFFYALHIGSFSAGAYAYRNFGLADRLMTEARAVWFYVQLAFLPKLSAFSLFHDDIPISRGWLSPPSTAFAVAAWLAVLGALWRWGLRAPLIGFGVAWFIAGHLLESTGLALELVHEHRNYLPTVGLLLALGEAARLLWGQRLSTALPKLAVPFAVLPLLALAFLTGMRAHMYGDEARRALVEAAYHPQSALLQFEAGITIIDLAGPTIAKLPEQAQQADRYLRRAAELDPELKHPYLQLFTLACAMGKKIEPELELLLAERWRTRQFIAADRTAISHMVESGIAGTNCLSSRSLRKQLDAVLANPALKQHDRALILVKLANVSSAMDKDIVSALAYFRQAIAVADTTTVRLQYAMALYQAGDLVGARAELDKSRSRGRYIESWEPSVMRSLDELLSKAG